MPNMSMRANQRNRLLLCYGGVDIISYMFEHLLFFLVLLLALAADSMLFPLAVLDISPDDLVKECFLNPLLADFAFHGLKAFGNKYKACG